MSEVRDRFTVVKAEDDVFEDSPEGSDVKKGILQGSFLFHYSLLTFVILFLLIQVLNYMYIYLQDCNFPELSQNK